MPQNTPERKISHRKRVEIQPWHRAWESNPGYTGGSRMLSPLCHRCSTCWSFLSEVMTVPVGFVCLARLPAAVSGNEPALTPEIMARRVRWANVNLCQSEARLHQSVWHKLYFLAAKVFFDLACSRFTVLLSRKHPRFQQLKVLEKLENEDCDVFYCLMSSETSLIFQLAPRSNMAFKSIAIAISPQTLLM